MARQYYLCLLATFGVVERTFFNKLNNKWGFVQKKYSRGNFRVIDVRGQQRERVCVLTVIYKFILLLNVISKHGFVNNLENGKNISARSLNEYLLSSCNIVVFEHHPGPFWINNRLFNNEQGARGDKGTVILSPCKS